MYKESVLRVGKHSLWKFYLMECQEKSLYDTQGKVFKVCSSELVYNDNSSSNF